MTGFYGIGFVQGSCSPGVRGTLANGREAGLPGMRTVCTGFSTIVLIALKIIKYVQKTSDIWIHKSTVIVSFCEGNYWFKMTAMRLLGHFVELSLSEVN